ncbi:MAG TPA: serine hydrolase domain-containing protein, partial [Planctomycetota bacterium]|nr:serine hydrolase domain-containing protein [Planctomycetota bacterium]
MVLRGRIVRGAALALALAWGAPRAHAQTDLGQRLDLHLQRLVPWGFSGSVLVARSGRVVLATGYGLADRAHGVANSALTQFPLGGVAQQFTAAAVLLLADQGRLTLDDTLGSHLEGVPTDKQAITLRQLLHQESGLPLDAGTPFGAVESKEEALARILGAPLEFAPGARTSPSNAGYALLCAIVEKIGAVPFEEFARAKILEPAGMASSVFAGEAQAANAPFAHAYVDDNDQGSPAAWQRSWPLLGAGALIASVGDLYRWERALSSEGLLSARGVEALHETGLRNAACGLFILRGDGDKRIAQRASALAGFQIEARRGLDEPLAWALLLNEAMPAAVKHVDALLAGRTLPLPPEVGALDPKLSAAA